MAHLTREEVLKSGEIAPSYRKAFEARPFNLSGANVTEWRTSWSVHLETLRHLYPIPGPIPESVTETLHNVPTRDGSCIRVRVYQPVNGAPEGGSPLIMMHHEGGWCMGELADQDMNCRMFTRELGAVCINVEYRLAPEFKFPTGIHDCWDAIKWAITQSSLLGATPSRGLIVGGSSAGGNIAAALALLSRDEKLDPPITGQYLSMPALLPDTNVPPHLVDLYESRTKNINDPALKTHLIGAIEAVYAPETNSPLWDPFNHPAGHKEAPKAFFQVGGLDPLRDEAVLYDRALRNAGVLTRFELYAGYGHMFWTNYPEEQRSAEFVRDTLMGMKWLLEDK